MCEVRAHEEHMPGDMSAYRNCVACGVALVQGEQGALEAKTPLPVQEEPGAKNLRRRKTNAAWKKANRLAATVPPRRKNGDPPITTRE